VVNVSNLKISELEKEGKRLVIRLHQEVIGKGPENVWVKINRNVASFCLIGAFTPMEEYIWTLPGGIEQVKAMRYKIYESMQEELYKQVKNISGVKMLNLTMKICEHSQIIFGTALFAENLEAIFEK